MARLWRSLTLRVWMALVVAPGFAMADTQRITADMVADALVAQGFQVESVTRTLLRRIRIVARQGAVWREVVLDLSTGQILRDYAVEFSPTELPERHSTIMPRGGRLIAPEDLTGHEN
jgi:hypothetical protein